MLNNWEQERWDSIEQELAGDRDLATVFEGRTRPHWWSLLADVFWPGGYVAGAVVVMLVALGGGARLLGWILLVCVAVWLGVEVHDRRPR